MALDRAIDNMILQVRDSGHRASCLDTFIQRGEPPGISAAPASASHAKSSLVHFGPRLEIIQSANTIPGLNSGGGVSARIPPPHAFAVGAVMNAFDFAKLHGIQHQANI